MWDGLRLLSRDDTRASDDCGLLDYGISGDDCAASRQSCMQQVVLGGSHFLGGQYGVDRADAAEIQVTPLAFQMYMYYLAHGYII